MTAFPQPVTDLVDVLTAIPGTIAVVLGGSRAVRSHDDESDWDLGVYYQGEIDLTALSALGKVFPYLAGIPTYTFTAELASCLPLHGTSRRLRFRRSLPKPRRRFGASVDRSFLTTRGCMRDAATLPVSSGRRLRRLWKRHQNIDGKETNLTDALSKIVGMNAGALGSCIPGKLAYFEMEGLGKRYLLIRRL